MWLASLVTSESDFSCPSCFVSSRWSRGFHCPLTRSTDASRHLYQFQGLGDDDEEAEFTSTDYPDNGNTDGPLPYAFFTPRPLQNLLQVDTVTSLDPITDAQVVNLLGATSDTPQIYAMCGRGPKSTFRTLKQGLEVAPVVASPLPGVPTAVWTLKLREDGESRPAASGPS